MTMREYLADEIANDCADGLLTRREALRRLGLLGLGAAAATTLLAACGDDDDDDDSGAASTTGPTVTTPASPGATPVTFRGPRGELQGVWAAASDPKGAVLVIHENRGLTDHIKTIPPRLARDGYSALAIDLLSQEGGTAAVGGEAEAQAALGGASDERIIADVRAGIDELERRAPDTKLAMIGFCFGGGVVWRTLNAGEPRLAAAVPFYGPAPENPDFSKSEAAVFGIYGETDTFVNPTRERAEAALERAGLTHQIKTYPGAGHAFFNDSNPQRFNAAAAEQAYKDLLAWFETHLG